MTLCSQPASQLDAIALDAASDVAVLGTRFSGVVNHGYIVEVTVRPVTATAWTPLVDVSEPATTADPFGSIALDGAGDAIAV